MNQIEKNKVIFLDRDGVINHDLNYVYKIEDFNFIEGVFEACRCFLAKGYQIIIITNQAGIGRGYYTEQDFSILTQWMLAEFKQQGIDILDVYFCPHHPTHGIGEYLQACHCRKPEPGMLLEAIKKYNISPEESILVGDKLSDIQAGKAARVERCFFVKTGHDLLEQDIKCADGVFKDLKELASFLIE